MANNKKTQALLQLILVAGILIFVNVLARNFFIKFDLTQDNRFTLSDPTKKLIADLDERVYVKVLLDGEFPAGFKRLQNATREILDEFRSLSPNLDYEFENQSEGTVEQINARRENLAKQQIQPTVLRVKDVDENKELIIYPWAVVNYKGRQFNVNLLESEIMGVPNEVVLNNSVSLLEYKFANALQKLMIYRKRPIIFTTGHGELDPIQVADLRGALNPTFNTTFVDLDSAQLINQEIQAVIVARPRIAFSKREKFILDQYIMKGGKVLWLIDALNVSLDSLRTNEQYIPLPYELNIDDQLYNYGARIKQNLVLDLFCTRIPLVTGQLGSGNQYDLFPYFYFPLVSPASNHPISRSLDRVYMQYPSTIDTVRTKTPVKKTFLLASSDRSRTQNYLTRLNFEVLRYDPDPSKFNKGRQPIALVLEGVFPSHFEDRIPASFESVLKQTGNEFAARSVPTRMLVVSDADFIKNLYNPNTQKVSPIGFNQFERRTFTANKDFIINSIEYLLDDNGVIEARSKEVKLRMLDKTKAREERAKWQLVNIVGPLLILGIFGFLFYTIRRRRYA